MLMSTSFTATSTTPAELGLTLMNPMKVPGSDPGSNNTQGRRELSSASTWDSPDLELPDSKRRRIDRDGSDVSIVSPPPSMTSSEETTQNGDSAQLSSASGRASPVDSLFEDDEDVYFGDEATNPPKEAQIEQAPKQSQQHQRRQQAPPPKQSSAIPLPPKPPNNKPVFRVQPSPQPPSHPPAPNFGAASVPFALGGNKEYVSPYINQPTPPPLLIDPGWRDLSKDQLIEHIERYRSLLRDLTKKVDKHQHEKRLWDTRDMALERTIPQIIGENKRLRKAATEDRKSIVGQGKTIDSLSLVVRQLEAKNLGLQHENNALRGQCEALVRQVGEQQEQVRQQMEQRKQDDTALNELADAYGEKEQAPPAFYSALPTPPPQPSSIHQNSDKPQQGNGTLGTSPVIDLTSEDNQGSASISLATSNSNPKATEMLQSMRRKKYEWQKPTRMHHGLPTWEQTRSKPAQDETTEAEAGAPSGEQQEQEQEQEQELEQEHASTNKDSADAHADTSTAKPVYKPNTSDPGEHGYEPPAIRHEIDEPITPPEDMYIDPNADEEFWNSMVPVDWEKSSWDDGSRHNDAFAKALEAALQEDPGLNDMLKGMSSTGEQVGLENGIAVGNEAAQTL
ncbi:hypothetical protein KEM55_009122 [Ascosphaera atra]|nr:hypothetical protein KEM55_009122 [Ascosphaera atra]